MLRTHNCGQLNPDLAGKEAILCGWVSKRRDHGKIIFIDLRDRYGTTQVVFTPRPHKETYALAKQLKNEDVVKIKGQVNLRPKGTENTKIPTGMVELFAQELEIINSSSPLPFEIEDSLNISEEIRLRYRYLDLRRPDSLKKLILRHKVNQTIRNFLSQNDFLEIETPFLTKATPEGARDFIVPSRLNSDKFYALPQSPQLFKQILMVAGVDKYYQIVRCFRDEDLRKDRQPEFTQLDIEMSFLQEEDIFSLSENLIQRIFSDALGIELPIPFPRISYQEALAKYSTDKPDIGEGKFRFCWVVDFPLFSYNEEEKKWDSEHHPFTAPHIEDMEKLDKNDLSRIRARSYDLIFNGEEIASGSIRIHEPALQKKIFSIIGISEKEAEEKFDFLLRSFQYGAPPHGGIAFGLDRFYAIISSSESIRDVIAFPKTQKGICPLSGAPSEIEEKQLKELGIKILEKNKEEVNR